MTTKRRPLCGKNDEAPHFIAEQHLLAEIAKEHPEWSKDDGACPQCIAYYRRLSDAAQVIDSEPDELDYRVLRAKQPVRSPRGC